MNAQDDAILAGRLSRLLLRVLEEKAGRGLQPGRSGLSCGRMPSILAGVSGGADSIAMLHLLHEVLRAAGAELGAAHVNYGLRGEESDEDEAFVRRICAELGVPLQVLRLEGGHSSILREGNLQENARRIRYDFFEECRRKGGYEWIAVAHHALDQAETLLFRLARGSGTHGAGCMKEFDPARKLWRPLLRIHPAVLRRWLQRRNIPWREDSSNRKDDYSRNLVRHRIIPALERINEAAVRNMARYAAQASRDDEALAAWAAEAMQNLCLRLPTGAMVVDAAGLRELPEAVSTRLLGKAWKSCPVGETAYMTLEESHLAELESLVRERREGTINLPGRTRACLEDDCLLLEHQEPPRLAEETPAAGGGRPCAVAVMRLCAGELSTSADRDDPAWRLFAKLFPRRSVRLVDIGGTPRVRVWHEGEFLVNRHGRPIRVNALLRHLPLFLRRHVPVVEAGSEIVWVWGTPPVSRHTVPIDEPASGGDGRADPKAGSSMVLAIEMMLSPPCRREPSPSRRRVRPPCGRSPRP